MHMCLRMRLSIRLTYMPMSVYTSRETTRTALRICLGMSFLVRAVAAGSGDRGTGVAREEATHAPGPEEAGRRRWRCFARNGEAPSIDDVGCQQCDLDAIHVHSDPRRSVAATCCKQSLAFDDPTVATRSKSRVLISTENCTVFSPRWVGMSTSA